MNKIIPKVIPLNIKKNSILTIKPKTIKMEFLNEEEINKK